MFAEYVYETDTEKQSDSDRNTQKIVELFWGNCPVCLNNGKPHHNTKASDQYNLVNDNSRVVASVSRFKDVLRAANKLNSMTHEQRSDVAYYYGISPIGKTSEELLVALADGDSDKNGVVKGFCLRSENLDGFLRVFVDGKSDDTEMIIILKKAVAYGVIDNKINEGRNNYYLGESYMGSDELGMIDWSRKNPRDYNEHIVRIVNEKDKKESKEDKSLENQKKVDLNKLDELRRTAKELKVEGFIEEKVPTQSMGFEKLSAIVAEAQNKKEAVPSRL